MMHFIVMIVLLEYVTNFAYCDGIVHNTFISRINRNQLFKNIMNVGYAADNMQLHLQCGYRCAHLPRSDGSFSLF